MKNPEVSIITPVFNGYKYINDAVNSILNQTYTDFEWIIVDDSSTDMTHIVLNELAARYNFIKLIRAERNMGPVEARNLGLARARGRFIALKDIDDLWMPEKLEKQIAFMKKKKAGLSYTRYRKIDLANKEIGKFRIPVPSRINRRRIQKTCSIMASSAVYDTDITGKILQNPDVQGKDDLFFWIQILEKCEWAYGIKEDLALLRIHGDSWTGNKVQEAKKQWHLYRAHLGMGRLKAFYYFSHYAVAGTLKFIL